MVARSEAHDSGLCSAAAETRRRFAQDLLNLTLAGPRLNRYQKRAHDAAEWLPPENKCWFAARVVEVRRKYGLTIDRREAAALERVLAGCSSTEMVVGECAPVSEPPARRLSESTGGSPAPKPAGTGSRPCRAATWPTATCGTPTATAWSANSRWLRSAAMLPASAPPACYHAPY